MGQVPAAAPDPVAENALAPPAPGQQACERCGGGFHCGVQGAAPCACTGVHLTPDHREALRRHYRHCLCIACLAEIARGAPVVAPAAQIRR